MAGCRHISVEKLRTVDRLAASAVPAGEVATLAHEPDPTSAFTLPRLWLSFTIMFRLIAQLFHRF